MDKTFSNFSMGMCYGCSLEVPQGDSSNGCPQHILFSWGNGRGINTCWIPSLELGIVNSWRLIIEAYG